MIRIASIFLAGLVATAFVAEAWAQGPGSSAYRRAHGGVLQIDAAIVHGDGCQTIVSVGYGTPPGVAVPPPEELPATVVVGPDPRGCSGNRLLRRVFGVGSQQIHNLVTIFFVTESGQVIKRERVAIGNR